MLAIGIMGYAATRKQLAVPVAAFMIITNLCFKLSVGPSCYTIVGEMSSNRVRAQTIVIGRAIYVVGQIVSNQLNPRMLNDTADAWNWGPRAGIFYFGFDVVWFIWTYFYLPETKNRSFADIDYLFQKKTKAREFTTAPIDRRSQFFVPFPHLSSQSC
jgi:SP family general alpha glucoside:H+ symporter-like MFS transporter